MRFLATAQGLYYLAAGIWPILHIDSFQAVTGAKTDLWLVRTVGLLIAVIGAAVLAARKRPALSPEMFILAAGSALALGTIDVVYALRGEDLPARRGAGSGPGLRLDAALEAPQSCHKSNGLIYGLAGSARP